MALPRAQRTSHAPGGGSGSTHSSLELGSVPFWGVFSRLSEQEESWLETEEVLTSGLFHSWEEEEAGQIKALRLEPHPPQIPHRTRAGHPPAHILSQEPQCPPPGCPHPEQPGEGHPKPRKGFTGGRGLPQRLMGRASGGQRGPALLGQAFCSDAPGKPTEGKGTPDKECHPTWLPPLD